MVRFIAVSALALLATPALAAERAHAPHHVSKALKAGCSVHHVHTPAGKTVHQPAIVHCKRAATVDAAQVVAPRDVRPATGTN